MRTRSSLTSTCICLLVLLCLPLLAIARASFDNLDPEWQTVAPRPAVDLPNTQFAVHDIGKMGMTITNFGTFGTGYISGGATYNGEEAPSCQYPINSNLRYLYAGSVWVGAIVGRDTLVSVGAGGWSAPRELMPDGGAAGAIVFRSNLPSRPDYDPDAVSEQDFLCRFTDTVTYGVASDNNDNRPHIPINVAIQQNSYAWSYDYAEDFVLFDYKITNIGVFPIRQMYLAIYIDADVYHMSIRNSGYSDDICGFRRTVKMPAGFGIDEDTVNIAWIADNDGDPVDGGGGQAWAFTSPVAVTGTRVVRSPNEDLKYSFNWWISNGNAAMDFGPRMAGTDDDPFRSFGAHLGTPTGDKNKYYVMSHPEFDYDQLFSAVSHTNEGYLAPPRPDQAVGFANGYDTRYLLSFGPFDVDPGDTLPVTLAYIAGDEFHVNPDDFVDYFDAFNPNAFYEKLDFKDFGDNARWAAWVFDNPGYDTDGDEDSGKFNWACQGPDTTIYFPMTENPPEDMLPVCRKVFYAGDGVPDFRGAAPPPPPVITVTPEFGKVTVRWNGQASENAIDVFSGQMDFEGYRVYYSLSNRLSDFVLLTGYDLDDYKRYEFNPVLRAWEQTTVPFTRDSLRVLYGANFEPQDHYNEFHYFEDPQTGQLSYFVAQDWNQSDYLDPNLIHKVYPNASRDDENDTTSEGWQRYYEYEYTIDNLQPSVPYYFSVTAFDYGSLKTDLGALESSPLTNAVRDYALPASEVVEDQALEVIVYPNPYRIDGGYAAAGYENRDRTKSAERTRAINFANLPRVCKIKIYSIDGDLIKEIDHNHPEGGPGSQHETWNVISRNTQAVVTGIYLWHVQSEMGEQLGKLVIIK